MRMTMANACGCDHDPATWASQVEGACLRQGAQLTPLRRRVLDIFSGSAAPLGAYAILEELSRREGKQVAPPTVYRTLDFFLEHGFVHKIESLNAYAPCEHLDHAHHGMLLDLRGLRAQRGDRRRGSHERHLGFGRRRGFRSQAGDDRGAGPVPEVSAGSTVP